VFNRRKVKTHMLANDTLRKFGFEPVGFLSVANWFVTMADRRAETLHHCGSMSQVERGLRLRMTYRTLLPQREGAIAH